MLFSSRFRNPENTFSNATQIILDIYITQHCRKDSDGGFWWNFSGLLSLPNRLQVSEHTFWLNCDLFTLFCVYKMLCMNNCLSSSYCTLDEATSIFRRVFSRLINKWQICDVDAFGLHDKVFSYKLLSLWWKTMDKQTEWNRIAFVKGNEKWRNLIR